MKRFPVVTLVTLCPHCGGRKQVSVGTDMVPCATCNETGKIRISAQKQDS